MNKIKEIYIYDKSKNKNSILYKMYSNKLTIKKAEEYFWDDLYYEIHKDRIDWSDLYLHFQHQKIKYF